MKKTAASIILGLAVAGFSFGLEAEESLPASPPPAAREASAAPAPPVIPQPRDYEHFPQALGFQYGELSGSGLSYQFWDHSSGFQLSFGGWYIPPAGEGYASTVMDYSIGVEYQYSVYGEDFADWLSGQIYLFAALNHRGTAANEEVTPPVYDSDYNLVSPGVYAVGDYMPSLNGGIGLGMEIILFEHFSIPLEVGYGAFWNLATNALEVRLVPQAGFRYRF